MLKINNLSLQQIVREQEEKPSTIVEKVKIVTEVVEVERPLV